VDVRVGDKTYIAEYLQGHTPSGVQLFFVRCDEFFDRDGIYGEHGTAYEDNAARFIFFSKAAVELARRLTPTPQILHVHDWPAAQTRGPNPGVRLRSRRSLAGKCAQTPCHPPRRRLRSLESRDGQITSG